VLSAVARIGSVCRKRLSALSIAVAVEMLLRRLKLPNADFLGNVRIVCEIPLLINGHWPRETPFQVAMLDEVRLSRFGGSSFNRAGYVRVLFEIPSLIDCDSI
jgi:hypothetical protein